MSVANWGSSVLQGTCKAFYGGQDSSSQRKGKTSEGMVLGQRQGWNPGLLMPSPASCYPGTDDRFTDDRSGQRL